MKTLELKHLAPYLPYGLKVYHCPYNSFSEEEKIRYSNSGKMEGIYIKDNQFVISIQNTDSDGAKWDGKTVVPLFDVKPILRPLSDLTKEIEHNGEKFVPIQRIFNAEGQNIEFRYDTKGLIPSLKRTILYGKHESFEGEETIGYLSHNYKNMFGYQLEKLFEWHFDVFGLIAEGLAIDINTLNK